MIHVQNKEVTNWSKTFSCTPNLFFIPENEDDIKEILKKAENENRRVKVIGRGHSPSDIAFTDDFLISMEKMNNLLKVDYGESTVTVQAGMTLKDLNEVYLPLHGIALSIQSSISDVTVAGALSTATHGSGIQRGTFCSSVAALTLMTINGQVMKCSREENIDIFLSVCCGLGALAIILTVTLQCEQAFNLHQVQYGCTLTQVLNSLDDHLSTSDYFKFFWFPHTDDAAIFDGRKTDLQPTKNVSWFWLYLIGYHLLELLYWFSTFLPSLVPIINQVYYKCLYKVKEERVDRNDRILNYECLFSQYVNEWCIPRENTSAVLLELKDWLLHHPEVKAHFPVEVRFVKKEEFYLSPTYGRNSTYVNIIMYKPYNKVVPYANYWKAYENIMRKNGGRPHWAKAHSAKAQDFLSMYPEFNKWCNIRNQLDPNKLFYNSYLERIFDG